MLIQLDFETQQIYRVPVFATDGQHVSIAHGGNEIGAM